MLTTSQGVELAVEQIGGSGPTLVLVHGGATDSRELEAIAASPLPQAPASAAPTRVLVAAQGGNPAFVQIADRVSAALPVADVVRVPGLPHFAVATEPEAFVRAVDQHFARC